MSFVSKTGTDATAAAKASTTATSKSQYDYPGQKSKQQKAARKHRIKELEIQLKNAQSLERTFHLMALQVDAELAEAREAL